MTFGAFAIFTFLVTCAFHAVMSQQSVRMRNIPKASTTGNGFFSTTARSRLDCSVTCSKDNRCDVSSFDSSTKTCKLCQQLHFSLKSGPVTSSVMIRRPLPIVHAVKWGNFAVHQQECEVFGGTVTTYEVMENLFNNQGLHLGTCTRVSNGLIYYALQYEVPGVGYAGINECYWLTDANLVFCTIPGP